MERQYCNMSTLLKLSYRLNTASIKMQKIFLECERVILKIIFQNIRVKNTSFLKKSNKQGHAQVIKNIFQT